MLERLLRRRVRDDTEFAFQDRSALMVGAHRPGTVAQIGLPLHQGAMADLLQRLELDPAARHIDGPGQVTVPRPRLAEQVAQVHALALDPGSRLEQPVVIDAGQEVAAILGDRRGGMRQDPLVVTGRRGGQGRLPSGVKDAQVDAARVGVTPAQIRWRYHQRRLVVQQLAQLVQLAAQVGQGLGISRVRPEQAGNPLPGLWRSSMDGQEGDQGNGPRRTHPDAGPGTGDGLLPQQRHTQHGNAFP